VHHESGDRPAKGKSRHQTPGGVPSPLDAVRQLLAEKAKFAKWLTDLDAKRASTPTHVFDRVHADYSGRLHGVVDQLKTHAAAMQDHAASLSKKLDQLTESEQGILDTRAESELRAEVGELAEDEWEKISKKLERDLAKIKQDQALIASDLNDLRAILAETADGGGAASASASPPPPESVGKGSPSVESAPAAAASTPNVDELAFLKSVIGTTPASRPSSAPGVPPTPPPAAPPAVRAEPVAAPKPPAKPADKLVETPPPGPVIRSKPGEEPLAMHVTGSNPIVLRSSGVVEQPKTMKCGECGSMNYPSEWYCERCGAELTSV
jgi:hypothetical protein